MSAHPTKEPKRYTALIPDDSGIAREVVLASDWDRLQAENERLRKGFQYLHDNLLDLPKDVLAARIRIILADRKISAAAPQVAKEGEPPNL